MAYPFGTQQDPRTVVVAPTIELGRLSDEQIQIVCRKFADTGTGLPWSAMHADVRVRWLKLMREAIDEAQAHPTIIDQFIAERIVRTAGVNTRASDLYAAYQAYALSKGAEAFPQRCFGDLMRDRFQIFRGHFYWYQDVALSPAQVQ